MISPKKLFNEFKKNKINFFIGVPDSVLKNFTNNIPEKQNFVTQNEGSAVALSIGYHLDTNKTGLVYMQNSGLGNAINPLISLAHKKVYSIPLILLIGWRGSPNTHDEPQHKAQGEITRDLLKLMDIKYVVLNNDNDLQKIKDLISHSKKNLKPVAILIKNKSIRTFSKKIKTIKKNNFISRKAFIENLVGKVKLNDRVISSTGYNSRELYQTLLDKKKTSRKVFYLVGGMGHTLSVGLGAALNSKKQNIILDGDGSLLMHMGSFINLQLHKKKNLKYILLNNNSHESVGGQINNIRKINLRFFAKTFGFRNYFEIKKKSELNKKIFNFLKSKESTFLNVYINEGTLKNLKRPQNLIDIKNNFKK